MIGREQHCRELAGTAKATLEFTGYYSSRGVPGGWITPSSRAIRIESTSWDDQRTYFCALHEVGHATLHFADDSPSGAYYGRELQAEAEAWLFALDNAREEPTPETVEWALGCYSTYLTAGFVVDDPNDPVVAAFLARCGTTMEELT